VQASTISAIAGSVSATIGGISATVAAVSAFSSRKSAQASEAALRETRQQREIDNARTELRSIGAVYDDALTLVEALAVDLRRDPAAVERAREAVRRSMLVAGLTTPALLRLAEANAPLSGGEVSAVREEIAAESNRLHRILTGGTPARPELAPRTADG
jgi:hypothetical protein